MCARMGFPGATGSISASRTQLYNKHFSSLAFKALYRGGQRHHHHPHFTGETEEQSVGMIYLRSPSRSVAELYVEPRSHKFQSSAVSLVSPSPPLVYWGEAMLGAATQG